MNIEQRISNDEVVYLEGPLIACEEGTPSGLAKGGVV